MLSKLKPAKSVPASEYFRIMPNLPEVPVEFGYVPLIGMVTVAHSFPGVAI